MSEPLSERLRMISLDAEYTNKPTLAEAADLIDALVEALEEIVKQNQEREWRGDDASDGYGNQGWLVRDGRYAKIARAALARAKREYHAKGESNG